MRVMPMARHKELEMFLPPHFIRHSTLPSPSPVLTRLYDLLFQRDTNIRELTDVMKGDASLTARVIRSANAAFSSPVNKVDNLHDAVIRIGLIPTIHIITATEIGSIFYGIPFPYGDIQALWKHNILVAVLSEAYGLQIKCDNPGIWFTAGLLHDIGRLLLINHDPAKYAEVLEVSNGESAILLEAECARFDYSHDIAGAYLLKFWNMPDDAVDAAADHHRAPGEVSELVAAVSMCNQIAHGLTAQDGPHLPSFSGVSTEKIVADAAGKYELMKKVMGI